LKEPNTFGSLRTHFNV